MLESDACPPLTAQEQALSQQTARAEEYERGMWQLVGDLELLERAKAEAEDFLTKEFQICQKQKVSHMLERADAAAFRNTTT